MLHALHRPADAALIHVITGHHLFPGGGKAGFDISRLHGTDADAEGPQLVGQRHGVVVNSGLGGAVIGLKWDGHRRRHTAEVDDPSAALRPHQGDHAAIHPHHAEKVGVKQPPGLLSSGKFDGAGDAEARVIDHQIDASLFCHHLCHSGGQRLLLGNIRHNMAHVRHTFPTAAQLINGPAIRLQRQRGGSPDAGGTSGDNGDLTHDGSPLRRR